jgi:hypothetical protein
MPAFERYKRQSEYWFMSAGILCNSFLCAGTIMKNLKGKGIPESMKLEKTMAAITDICISEVRVMKINNENAG